MKKRISMALVFCMVMALFVPMALASTGFGLGAPQYQADGTVKIPVTATATALTGVEFSVNYDPAVLEFDSYENVAAGIDCLGNAPTPGTVKVAGMVGLGAVESGITVGDVLGNVVFKAIGGSGATSSVSLSGVMMTPADDNDPAYENIGGEGATTPAPVTGDPDAPDYGDDPDDPADDPDDDPAPVPDVGLEEYVNSNADKLGLDTDAKIEEFIKLVGSTYNATVAAKFGKDALHFARFVTNHMGWGVAADWRTEILFRPHNWVVARAGVNYHGFRRTVAGNAMSPGWQELYRILGKYTLQSNQWGAPVLTVKLGTPSAAKLAGDTASDIQAIKDALVLTPSEKTELIKLLNYLGAIYRGERSAPAPGTTPGTAQPRTGSEMLPVMVLGALMMIGGAVVLLPRKRFEV